MKRIVFLVFSFLLLVSCDKKEKISNKFSETENIVDFNLRTSDEENKNNSAVSTDYNFLLMITNDLEVGYDNKNVYLTESSTGTQIVFICDDKGMYSQQDLLDSFKYAAKVWAVRDKAAVERWATRLPRWHIQDAFQHKKEFDKHFNKELDKYYVNYRDVYSDYHT